jgi:glycosyltransferase involved in cell wall biosynthesis
MKIVQLVTQMEAGGAQQVAVLLSEALQQRGYDSEVWFLYLKRPSHSHLPGVRVVLDHKPAPLDYFRIVVRLYNLLRATQPDVLITHTHYANVLGQIVGQLSGVPRRIAVQHNLLYTYPKVAAWIDWVLGMTPCYSQNVAVSGSVIDSAAPYPDPYRQKLTKIYNGMAFKRSKRSRQAVREHWHLPKNAPLLLNIGRLARQKNHAILFETLTHLQGVHLAILGDGELRESLQQRVVELGLTARVHFLGELPSIAVSDLLAAADLFVFPSLFEAMPMALIEAMSTGIPIIASDIPSLREVLGEAACFVPTSDGKAIAMTIQQLLASPEETDQMRHRSLARSGLFSLETMVNSYEMLFAS